jgi:hypothetical protein
MPMLQQHADTIIRDAPPTREHKEYPKYMTHPAYQPGRVGEEVRSPAGFSYHVGGTPIRYPPMLVRDADQEEYYRSQGYVTQGKSDPAAFAAAVQAMPPPDENYRPKEYPKWVGDFLVNNREEEEAAAHKRRVQLGIEPPGEEDAPEITPTDPVPEIAHEAPPEPAPSPESNPPPAPQTALLDARMTALEADMSEIKLMFVQFMAANRMHPPMFAAPEAMQQERQAAAEAPVPDETLPEPATPAKQRAKSAKPRKPQSRRSPRDTQTARAAKQVAALMATS